MAAPILWAPRKIAFFLQENLHAHEIPRFRRGRVFRVWVFFAYVFRLLERQKQSVLAIFEAKKGKGKEQTGRPKLVVLLGGRCHFYFYGRGAFSEYVPFLLGVGVVFNILTLELLSAPLPPPKEAKCLVCWLILH